MKHAGHERTDEGAPPDGAVAGRDDSSHDSHSQTAQHPGHRPDDSPWMQQYRSPVRRLPAFSREHFTRYVWHEIDAADRARLATLDSASRAAYERLGYVPGAERFSLGHFRIDAHHTVAFEVIPELGEVSYSEIVEYAPGTAVRPTKEDESSASPLLRFLQLTDKSVPVPQMLEEFDESSDEPETVRALAGRDLVDDILDYGRQLDDPTLTGGSSPSLSVPSTCGVGGGDIFSANYCEDKGTWYCDETAWTSLTRTSGSKRRKTSHSRVAACGSYSTILEHQFRHWDWLDVKWRWVAVMYPNPPAAWSQSINGGSVKFWKHVSSKKRRRRIRISTEAPSYFRAWTAFY